LRTVLRFSIAIIVLICCYRFAADSFAAGTSRFLSMLSIIQSSVAPADDAVRLTPDDPEAHYTRGLALINRDRLEESVNELQAATRLRPYHYYEWLDLGVTLDRMGDRAGAIAAVRESIRLAPAFAQPHWQYGNILFRDGRYDEAFAELQLGVASNPNLFAGMLDLGWLASGGDVGLFIKFLNPQTRMHRFEVGLFLASKGIGRETAKQIEELGAPQNEQERDLTNKVISELIARANFADAFDVWRTGHSSSGTGREQIFNGDFQEGILSDEPAFGWQLTKESNVSVVIDPSGPAANTRSLRIEFTGESAPAADLVHQVILAAPNSSYTLSFMAKTEKLVTGGPPMIVVLDIGSNPVKILNQSKPIAVGSSDWTAYTVDFSTAENSVGLSIRVQRLQCTQQPCPVFGKLWLSRFKLARAGFPR
jgi:tetratricopeptide (TPR) repeat protein